MKRLRERTDLPQEVKEDLGELFQRLRPPAVILRLVSEVLTREEARLVGDAGIGTPAPQKDWVSPVKILQVVARHRRLTALRLESGGAFMSAELLIKLRERGQRLVEVGVPHYARTAGSPTGAKPSVVLRAVKDFWLLRLRLWARRGAALRRGQPVLPERQALSR
jgi:hypothetical protein